MALDGIVTRAIVQELQKCAALAFIKYISRARMIGVATQRQRCSGKTIALS